MKHHMRAFIFAGLVFCFPSCLSIFVFPLYTKLDFENVQSGVTVEVLADGEVLEKFEAPDSVRVRTAERLAIRFSKDGYIAQTITTRTTPDFLGLMGSILVSTGSMYIGFFIDSASGATHSVYPDAFEVQLEPIATAAGPKLRFDVSLAPVDQGLAVQVRPN